ncbi:hypothetical protein PI124_g8712 [Phytophthora idaei]|nr:hypothetical protein PI125_g10625 [Phytophthora idaei]KAG3153629.1 hypothetical protein PI126_g9994 [Phytophthora idaei]KAG3246574.1 hypothetical protein PI124_g8712 [Phytophthora idaei]
MEIKPMTHVQYMCKLHMQLITLTADEMYEANTFQPAPDMQVPEAESSGHLAKQSEEWRDHSGQRKRVQKNCKICTLMTPKGKRGATSTYFCDGCDFPGPIYFVCEAQVGR